MTKHKFTNSDMKMRFKAAQDMGTSIDELKKEAALEIVTKDNIVSIKDDECSLIKAIILLKLNVSKLKFYEKQYGDKKFLLKKWKILLK